jgi:D-alanine--poly(phosphoribitol) ligase subunit 1
MTESVAEAIVLFLEADTFDTFSLVAELRSKLPPYMAPSNIRLLSSFPLNSNGKFDRQRLLKILQDESEAGVAASVKW